jgi:cobalt-zinc-cadmium efflux system protein
MTIDAHGHHHHHHVHAVSPDADRGRLAAALVLIAAFMVAEVIAGILSGSLALLSDAAHMLTDAGSIALALVAARLASRPPSGAFTFGLGRAEIISAQINGGLLLILAGVIAVEAVQRLMSPPAVDGAVVIGIGLLGAVVNVAAAWQLARAERRSLNVEGARAHVLTDLWASLAAAAAGLVIVITGFGAADGVAALLVAGLMIRSGWSLVRDASRVLLEGSPMGVDTQDVGRALAAAPGIVEVHDLHVWEVTSGFPALAAHVLVAPGDDCHARRRELERLVQERFGIRHTTLQVDHAAREELLSIRSPD